MSEEKKEPWLNLLALTTVILAVCATLATFKGGGHSTRSVLSQSKASDQWAHFQSKSIKGHLYEMGAERLELELHYAAKGSQDFMKEKLNEYKTEVARYAKEKAEISAKAKAFEEARDEASKHSGAFGMAVIFLQIAILLSSISALTKQKAIYYLALAIGALGVVLFANGFFLFM